MEDLQTSQALTHPANFPALGLLQQDPQVWFQGADAGDAARIERMIAERRAAKQAKEFARADQIRDQLGSRRDRAGGRSRGNDLAPGLKILMNFDRGRAHTIRRCALDQRRFMP